MEQTHEGGVVSVCHKIVVAAIAHVDPGDGEGASAGVGGLVEAGAVQGAT